jgi:hypothetical protein
VTHDWGTRLSDRIRATLAAGDMDAARRLALEGDGQARSLDKEYALMYRGLGITLRVLLDVVARALARMRGTEAAPALEALLRCFGADLRGLMTRAYGRRLAGAALASRDAAPGPEAGIDAIRRLLAAGEDLFAREQARLAREVVAALDADDTAAAARLIDEKESGQYLPLHDRLIRFMAEVFAWTFAHGGPDELLRVHRETAEGQRDGFERWERLPAADFARATAFLLKQHMGTVRVREDDEKFTVEQTPCGSGGRLRLLGAYTGPGGLPVVTAPGPLTGGEPSLPVYCTHCPVWNGLAPIEWFGRPHWVFDRPSRPDGSCTLHIYKRRDGAPSSKEASCKRSGGTRPGM